MTLTRELIEGWGEGYAYARQLPTGEWAALKRMMFTVGLFIIEDEYSWRERWCFEELGDALISLASWDGKGHPPGMWIKRKGRGPDLMNPEWARAHPEQATIGVKMADRITTEVDVSHVAICDTCGTRYHADSPEEGGWLFVSHADCPKCATPEQEKRIEGYGESHYIVDRARPGETYFNFVMRVRNGNHKIRVTAPADDPLHEIARENAQKE